MCGTTKIPTISLCEFDFQIPASFGPIFRRPQYFSSTIHAARSVSAEATGGERAGGRTHTRLLQLYCRLVQGPPPGGPCATQKKDAAKLQDPTLRPHPSGFAHGVRASCDPDDQIKPNGIRFNDAINRPSASGFGRRAISMSFKFGRNNSVHCR